MPHNATLIWAQASNRVIGKNNALPWNSPAELAHFRRETMGKTLVMGRKTFLSLGGKTLPGRQLVVLSKSIGGGAFGPEIMHHSQALWRGNVRIATVFDSIKAALTANPGAFVIGGANVFQQALPLARKAIVSIFDFAAEGDALAPDLHGWHMERIKRIENFTVFHCFKR